MKVSSWIQSETRATSYGILFGTWAIVALYAVLHDQAVQVACYGAGALSFAVLLLNLWRKR